MGVVGAAGALRSERARDPVVRVEVGVLDGAPWWSGKGTGSSANGTLERESGKEGEEGWLDPAEAGAGATDFWAIAPVVSSSGGAGEEGQAGALAPSSGGCSDEGGEELGESGASMMLSQAGQGPFTPARDAGTRSRTPQVGQENEILSWLMSVSKREADGDARQSNRGGQFPNASRRGSDRGGSIPVHGEKSRIVSNFGPMRT